MAKHSINKQVARQAATNAASGVPSGRHRASNPTTGNRPAVQRAMRQRQAANKGQGPKHAGPETHDKTEPPIAPLSKKKSATSKLVSRGSGTVKLEFLAGILLLVLAPIANHDIKMDKDYVRRVVAWVLSFMILFPLSSSSRPGIVRLANGFGGLLLLVIMVRGTSSGFGVDVPKLLNTLVAKVQPGGADLGIPTPPPGVTVPIPGEPGHTLTGPENGNQWTVGVSGDFTTPNIGHTGRFVE